MKFNEKHSAIMLERVFDCKYEQIGLVSRTDKRRTPIHRLILMAASKYFADLLQTEDSSERPNEFVLDATSEAIKIAVDFCYTGHIDLTEENVEKCLKIAVDGEIDLLLNKCHDYFSAKLSTENVVSVLLIADKYNISDLRERASDLLISHIEQVPTTNIHELSPETMMKLLVVPDGATPGDLLVDRLLRWFHHDEAERGEHMPRMLRLIRLKNLTSEFLCKSVEPLFKQFKCTELLYDEFKRRAMYYTLSSSGCSLTGDDTAATNEKSVFCVAVQTWIDIELRTVGTDLYVNRYNELLNKFERHCELNWLNIESPGSILFENKLFRIGGVGDDSMIAYELKTKKEKKLHPMNECRDHHSSILMGKSIYVFGGRGSNDDNLSSCERYDIEKGTWQIIKPMKHPRFGASAAILNGLIYVVGGCPGPLLDSPNFVESYDPKTDEWTERTALDVGVEHSPLVTFNGMLYAFLHKHGVREYDPAKNVWTKMQVNCGFRSVISANGRLIAITRDGYSGYLTIDEQKIRFYARGEIDIKNSDDISLQQCQFEQ